MEKSILYALFAFCYNLFYVLLAMRYTLLRHYATTDTVELHAPWKKKIKRRSKKYAELLEGILVPISNTNRHIIKRKK